MPRLYLGAKKTISSFVAGDKSISSYTTQFWIQHFGSSRLFAVSICGFLLYPNNFTTWAEQEDLIVCTVLLWELSKKGLKSFLSQGEFYKLCNKPCNYTPEDDGDLGGSNTGYRELCDMLMIQVGGGRERAKWNRNWGQIFCGHWDWDN